MLKKRLLSLLIAAVMVIGLMPVGVLADEGTYYEVKAAKNTSFKYTVTTTDENGDSCYETEEEAWAAVAEEASFKIGNDYYRSGAQSFGKLLAEDYPDGCTIEVLKDYNGFVKFDDCTADIVLDLKGHTLTASSLTTLTLSGKGSITVRDSSDDKTGKIVGSTAVQVNAGGNKVLDGISIEATSGNAIYTSNNNVNLTITNCVVSADTDDKYAISADNGIVKVTGGTFKGGLSGTEETLVISGGMFDVDPSSYIAENCIAVKDKVVNMWVVGIPVATYTDESNVAQNAPTLQSAINNVADGGTVTLLRNITLG